MPPLIRFILRNAAFGIAVGWTMVGAMLAFDFAGLATLIFASDMAAIAIVMLLAGFGITFGSAQVGIAVVGLDADQPPSGKKPAKRAPTVPGWMRAPVPRALAPVRVRRR